MGADKIHILPTGNTPEFLFNPDGIIKIKGRGLFSNNSEVNELIMKWIDEYINNPVEITYVIIAFEYLNSSSTSFLVTILKKLSQVILESKKIVIRWFYEEDDEDILERGQYVSESFNIPVQFIISNNIADV